MSLPAWGAWIEISINSLGTAQDASLPAWGAWIEIYVCQRDALGKVVAPRMGSVD